MGYNHSDKASPHMDENDALQLIERVATRYAKLTTVAHTADELYDAFIAELSFYEEKHQFNRFKSYVEWKQNNSHAYFDGLRASVDRYADKPYKIVKKDRHKAEGEINAPLVSNHFKIPKENEQVFAEAFERACDEFYARRNKSGRWDLDRIVALTRRYYNEAVDSEHRLPTVKANKEKKQKQEPLDVMVLNENGDFKYITRSEYQQIKATKDKTWVHVSTKLGFERRKLTRDKK